MRHGYIMGSLASTNTLYRPPDTPMWYSINSSGTNVTSTDNYSSIILNSTVVANRYMRLAVSPSGTIVGLSTISSGTYQAGQTIYSNDFGKTWNMANRIAIPASGNTSTIPQVKWSSELGGFLLNTGHIAGLHFSENGKEWTQVYAFATSGFAFTGDRVVLPGLNIGVYRILTKTGSTWSVAGGSIPFTASQIAYSPTLDRWVISRREATNSTNPNMAYSDDGGENWISYQSSIVGNSSTTQNLLFWSKTQNKFMMFADNSTTMMHSSDGITWTLKAGVNNSSNYPLTYYENNDTLIIWCTGNPIKYTGNVVPSLINLNNSQSQGGFYWDPTGALYT